MSVGAVEPACVVSFSSTHEALRVEALCQAAGVPGRLIPLPVQIHADCGLAWRMPLSARPVFEAAMGGDAGHFGYHELG